MMKIEILGSKRRLMEALSNIDCNGGRWKRRNVASIHDKLLDEDGDNLLQRRVLDEYNIVFVIASSKVLQDTLNPIRS